MLRSESYVSVLCGSKDRWPGGLGEVQLTIENSSAASRNSSMASRITSSASVHKVAKREAVKCSEHFPGDFLSADANKLLAR